MASRDGKREARGSNAVPDVPASPNKPGIGLWLGGLPSSSPCGSAARHRYEQTGQARRGPLVGTMTRNWTMAPGVSN